MSHKLKDVNRRNVNFRKRSVAEVLPEFFRAEYPDLIKVLEFYYNFLDSDSTHAFDTEVRQLNSIRDIQETPTEYLNLLINETTSLPGGGLFKDPRFTMTRFAESYRNKGSRFSIEEFFQAFYQQPVDVLYPKKDIFIVGESDIGYNSLKFIQNNAKYQIFSILVKVGLGTSQYETLYKKFVHPAGFYFEGEVITEAEANLNLDQAQIVSIPGLSVGIVQGEASAVPIAFGSMTGLVDSDGTNVRYSLNEIIQKYTTLSSSQLDSFYDNIKQIVNPNSFTFDDSDVVRPDLSLTFETTDNDMFTRYLSDSSF